MDSDYAAYLQSPTWKAKRESFRAGLGDNPRCQNCGRSAGGSRMNWHHVRFRDPHLGEETRQDVLYLCVKCHALAHGRKSWS